MMGNLFYEQLQKESDGTIQKLEWFPVWAKKPKDGVEVLIVTKSRNGSRNIDKGYYIEESMRWVHRGTAAVTHWMKLPELPEDA